MSEYYQASHRGREFLFTTVGADRPDWCRDSFVLEAALREEWWRPVAGEVVLDVGSAFGSYTLPALAHGARVFAADPSKEYMFSLLQNVAINPGFHDRFACLPFALGDSSGVIDFSEAVHSCLRGGGAERRLVLRIDDLPHLTSGCDWVKIDVEGMEEQVLRGAVRVLSAHRPTVLVECHEGFCPGVTARVAAFMQGLGYSGRHARGGGVNDHWSIWEAN